MKTKLLLLSALLVGLLGGSCSKNTIEIFPGSGENNNPSDTTSNSSKTTTLVTFHANIESLNLTKSMTPMQIGDQVEIYAYDSTSMALTANGNYTTTSLGVLSGVNGYKMYLTNGTYDFYAVSTNSDSIPPAFANYTSAPLSNGVDYLWWKANNQEIITSSYNLQIVFTHSCAQIVFEIADGTGITIDSLVSVSTTAPTAGTTMNLTTGVITPSTTRQSGFVNQMGLNGLTAQSILLPAADWPYLAVALTVYINGENTPRVFGGQIAIPNSTLLAGNSYLYKLILNANNIQTTSVEVVGWTIVNETGQPIYPGQLF